METWTSNMRQWPQLYSGISFVVKRLCIGQSAFIEHRKSKWTCSLGQISSKLSFGMPEVLTNIERPWMNGVQKPPLPFGTSPHLLHVNLTTVVAKRFGLYILRIFGKFEHQGLWRTASRAQGFKFVGVAVRSVVPIEG